MSIINRCGAHLFEPGGGCAICHQHYLDAAQERVRELEAALEECIEWMGRNPPSTGWGTLDRGEDADRHEISVRAQRILERKDP